ncbi:MAG: NUDIX domain-containing protein [bacterium]
MKLSYIQWLREKVGHDPLILLAVKGIVIDEHQKILVIKSKDKISNNWDLPGGLMEPGETARDALIREVEEETGIICEPTEFIGVYTNQPYIEYKNGDKAHVVGIFFLCRAIAGNLKPDGDESLETLFIDFALGYELLIRHKKTLDDFKNNLRGVIR